jgi:hypothetical protein
MKLGVVFVTAHFLNINVKRLWQKSGVKLRVFGDSAEIN